MFIARRRHFFQSAAHTVVGAAGGVLIAHGTAQFSSASSGATTASLNTTGATLIVVMTCVDSGATGVSVSDSISSTSNTWTACTLDTATSLSRLYYTNTTANPTVGSGHTFTLSATNGFGAMAVAAFSNATTSPLDQQSVAHGLSTSAASGSITPSNNNQLVVVGVGLGGAGGSTTASSLNGGFASPPTDGVGCATMYGAYISYLKQTTAAAANPTWTLSGSQDWGACIASFKGT